MAIHRGKPGNGSLGATLRLLEADSDQAILSALYSQSGRIFARLYEYQGQRVDVPLRYLGGSARFAKVNLLGEGSEPVSGAVPFQPWQISTIRIEPTR